MKPTIEFTAKIQQHKGMNAAFIDIPFSVEEVFGKKRVKIKTLFDDVEYRGSLVKMNGCYKLGLTQSIRKQLGKSFGEYISVKLWEDQEERIVEIPKDVQSLFNEYPKAYKLYKQLSYTHRKEYIRWITEAKKTETRENRKAKMIEMILAGKKGI